jgi:hypothetical protein
LPSFQCCQLAEISAAKHKSGLTKISAARKIRGRIFYRFAKNWQKKGRTFFKSLFFTQKATFLQKYTVQYTYLLNFCLTFVRWESFNRQTNHDSMRKNVCGRIFSPAAEFFVFSGRKHFLGVCNTASFFNHTFLWFRWLDLTLYHVLCNVCYVTQNFLYNIFYQFKNSVDIEMSPKYGYFMVLPVYHTSHLTHGLLTSPSQTGWKKPRLNFCIFFKKWHKSGRTFLLCVLYIKYLTICRNRLVNPRVNSTFYATNLRQRCCKAAPKKK